jgi:hypothetical protein
MTAHICEQSSPAKSGTHVHGIHVANLEQMILRNQHTLPSTSAPGSMIWTNACKPQEIIWTNACKPEIMTLTFIMYGLEGILSGFLHLALFMRVRCRAAVPLVHTHDLPNRCVCTFHGPYVYVYVCVYVKVCMNICVYYVCMYDSMHQVFVFLSMYAYMYVWAAVPNTLFNAKSCMRAWMRVI